MKKIFLFALSAFTFLGCHTNNNGTVTIIPLSPTNLTATVASTTQVDLSWTDNATNEDGYKIERKTGSGNYTIVGSTGANISTFSDMGLTANTTYTYRVYAHNSAGNSPQYSNEVSVTTSGVPTLTTTTISSVTAVGSVSGGEITDDGGSNVTARGVVWSTSSNPTISLSTKTTDGNGTGIFTSNISGLVANTTYYVRAYATNSTGTGYGNETSFTTSNIDITTGLVGYWPFNGNANDESGNGNNGTVNGATLTTDRFGNVNSAYSFNGISNFISGVISNLDNTSVTSLSAWLKCNGDAGGLPYDMFFQYGHIGSHTFTYSYNFSNNRFDLSSRCFPSPYFVEKDIANSWHHFVLTDYLGLINVYVDNVLVSTLSNNNNSNCYAGSNEFLIGGENDPSENQYFTGSIDDVRIYNRALTADEVSYLYTH